MIDDRAWRAPARALLSRWLRLEVEGADHVPDDGPVVLAAAHLSHADSLAIGTAVERPLTFLGDRKLASAPLVGPLLPRLGFHPVDRGSGDAAVLGELGRLLVEEDAAIVIYAEGSRSRDGAVHRPRSGVSRLAAATGAPVVPVGVSGTAEVWPVDGRVRLLFPLRGVPVEVRFGPPMPAPLDTPGDRREWTAQLHDQLVKLSGRRRSDTFAEFGGAGEHQETDR